MARKAVQQRYFIAEQTPGQGGHTLLRLVEEQKDAAECRKRMKSQEFAEEHGDIVNPLRVTIIRSEPAVVLVRKPSQITKDIATAAGDCTDDVVKVLVKHGISVGGSTVAKDMDAPIDLEAPQTSKSEVSETETVTESAKQETAPPVAPPVTAPVPPETAVSPPFAMPPAMPPAAPLVAPPVAVAPPPTVAPPPVGQSTAPARDPEALPPDDRRVWSRAQCPKCLLPTWYDTGQQKWFDKKSGYPEHVCAQTQPPTPPTPPGFPTGPPPVFGQLGFPMK